MSIGSIFTNHQSSILNLEDCEQNTYMPPQSSDGLERDMDFMGNIPEIVSISSQVFDVTYKTTILNPFDRRPYLLRRKFINAQVCDGEDELYELVKGRLVYKGGMLEEKCHGKGKYTYPNDDTYKGMWKEGEPHGQGTMKRQNGLVYKGMWKEGKEHGQGTVKYPNGDIYEGDFSEGALHGKGIYRFADGFVYKGDFFENKRHGQGTMTNPEGVHTIVEYVNNLPNGPAIVINNGIRIENHIWYKNGKLNERLIDPEEVCFGYFKASLSQDLFDLYKEQLTPHIQAFITQLTKGKDSIDLYISMKVPQEVTNLLVEELARAINDKIQPITTELKTLFSSSNMQNREDIPLSIEGIFKRNHLNPVVDAKIKKIVAKLNQCCKEKTFNPKQYFEEMKEKLSLSLKIAELLKCTLETLPKRIDELKKRKDFQQLKLAKEFAEFGIIDYQKFYAKLQGDKLLEDFSAEDSSKKQGTARRTAPRGSRSKKTSQPRTTASNKKGPPVKTPVFTSESPFSSSSDSACSLISESSQPMTRAQRRQLACDQLLIKKSKYKMAPRITRWRNSDPKVISQFLDRDFRGNPVQRYLFLRPEEIKEQRARHYLPGLERILSHPLFKKVYSYSVPGGSRAMAIEFHFGVDDHTEYGLVKFGIDGKKIYHRYFESNYLGQDIFEKLIPDLASETSEETDIDDEGFISTLPYTFSMDEQGALTVNYPGESHFIRISPLFTEPLQELLNSVSNL